MSTVGPKLINRILVLFQTALFYPTLYFPDVIRSHGGCAAKCALQKIPETGSLSADRVAWAYLETDANGLY